MILYVFKEHVFFAKVDGQGCCGRNAKKAVRPACRLACARAGARDRQRARVRVEDESRRSSIARPLVCSTAGARPGDIRIVPRRESSDMAAVPTWTRNQKSAGWHSKAEERTVDEATVEDMLERRWAAKERKDYAEADKIARELQSMLIAYIDDTKEWYTKKEKKPVAKPSQNSRPPAKQPRENTPRGPVAPGVKRKRLVEGKGPHKGIGRRKDGKRFYHSKKKSKN